MDFLIPALALCAAVHFKWIIIVNPDGSFNTHNFILEVVVTYIASVPFLDFAAGRMGLLPDPRRNLFSALSQFLRRNPKAGDAPESDFPYEVVSPQELPSKLPELTHPNIQYVRRQADHEYNQMVTTMKGAQHLLIIGRSGLGKTREAIELIRRLQDETGEEVSVLLPQGALDVPLSIPREKLKRHVVLFLDNLQQFYGLPYSIDDINDPAAIEGGFRERFYETVRVLQDCFGAKFHVVATAIGLPEWRAKLRLKDPFWKSFTICQLPDLSPKQCGELLSSIEQYLHIDILEDAKRQIALHSDGTPAGLIIPLVKHRLKKTITADEVKDCSFVYPRNFEEEVYRPVFSKNPHRRAILAALSVLQQTNMKMFVDLVIPLAARMVSPELQAFHRLMVKRALSQLEDWIPVSQSGIVSCTDAYILSRADASMEKELLLATVFDLLQSRRKIAILRPSLHELINYLLRLGDSDNAIKVYQWLLRANPDNAHARYRLANLYLSLGELDEAQDQCIAAICLVSHPDTWATLAGICFARRQFVEARSAYQIAIAKNPNRWIYWARLATIQDELRDYKGAVQSARNAVHLCKQLPLAHVCLAIAHEQAGQFDRAIRQAWYAIALAPNNSTAWQTLGISYSRAGLRTEAIKASTKATELFPESGKAWGTLARALEQAGQPGSLLLFEKACNLAPQDPSLKLSYGIALERACRFNEAEKVINEAVSLAPYDLRARSALHRIRSFTCEYKEGGTDVACDPHALTAIGKEYFNAAKFKDAVATFRDLVKQFPRWARAHQHLGASLLELNEVDQAADSLKTAVTLDSEMSKAQYLLGRALVCRKDYVEAEKALRESIRINPDFAPAHEELRRALEGQGFKY